MLFCRRSAWGSHRSWHGRPSPAPEARRALPAEREAARNDGANRSKGAKMDRETVKHGPRVDEMLKRETRSLQQGAPVQPRAEEDRPHEPAGHEALRAEAREA